MIGSRWRRGLALALFVAVLPTPLAAEGTPHSPSEVIFLFEIIALLVCGRLLGEVMQRVGQPAVMGQLLAGILLGPSVLGALSPELQQALFPTSHEQKSMIDAVSQLGILMLLLLTGMETDLSLVRKAGKIALSVSLAGIAIPFLCGILLGEFLPDDMLPATDRRLITTLFLGTALAISSVKIVAMTIRELDFMRRTLGQVTVAAAIIDDTIGWIIIAFVAGMLIGQSPILTRHIDEQLRGLIVALFMPVFFGLAGLSANLGVLADPSSLLLSLLLIVIASVGKFSGAFLGGAVGGLTWRESVALGCGMNARGSTEVVVATIGLATGALSQSLFTMILTMAVATTMAMPPMLRWAVSRVPLRPEDQDRLEREAFEAEGFVTTMERLLVAVDKSPNGRFASRLAGLLAGLRRLPTTIVHVSQESAARPARSATRR